MPEPFSQIEKAVERSSPPAAVSANTYMPLFFERTSTPDTSMAAVSRMLYPFLLKANNKSTAVTVRPLHSQPHGISDLLRHFRH